MHQKWLGQVLPGDACWAFDDDDHPGAAFNTLILSERRGRLMESDTATFLHGLAHLRVTVDRSPEEADVLSLARHRGLTIYDAAYLELARRERAPLATLDAALVAAARAEGVPLLSEPRQTTD
jgi:predicted nucleic acid-binding protein